MRARLGQTRHRLEGLKLSAGHDRKEDAPDAAQWLHAARAGSEEALGRLLDACRNYLLRVANARLEARLRRTLAPADVVQQTFLEAHRDFKHFQGETETELLAWLRRILLNTLANMKRDLKAQKRQHGRERSLEDLAGSALVAPDSAPGAGLIAQEERSQLQMALEQLPADYREVILLRHREELSFGAIGQRMNRSAEAARKLWARAIEQLQKILDNAPG